MECQPSPAQQTDLNHHSRLAHRPCSGVQNDGQQVGLRGRLPGLGFWEAEIRLHGHSRHREWKGNPGIWRKRTGRWIWWFCLQGRESQY